MDGLPVSETEIADFVAAFEACTLPKERWTHGAHLLTGAWYVRLFGEAAAIDRMRARVSAFNLSVGGKNTESSGYHETVTLFWIKRLHRFHLTSGEMPPAEFCHAAVREFEPRRGILAEYYAFDVVGSQVARKQWVAPDLMELD